MKCAATGKERKLLVTVHDVSPRHFNRLQEIHEFLDTLGIGHRYGMLVVPDFWAEWSLVTAPVFVGWLRSRQTAGVEMILHGYFHRDDRRHAGAMARLRARTMTAGEGEFLGLDYGTAYARIESGRAMLEEVLGTSIAGFVAPAWLYNEATKRALAEQSFLFAEDHWSVWSPLHGGRTVCRSPVVSYSARTRGKTLSSWAWSRLSTVALARSPVVRLAIHPRDLDSPFIVKEIQRALRAHLSKRSLKGYSELV